MKTLNKNVPAHRFHQDMRKLWRKWQIHFDFWSLYFFASHLTISYISTIKIKLDINQSRLESPPLSPKGAKIKGQYARKAIYHKIDLLLWYFMFHITPPKKNDPSKHFSKVNFLQFDKDSFKLASFSSSSSIIIIIVQPQNNHFSCECECVCVF